MLYTRMLRCRYGVANSTTATAAAAAVASSGSLARQWRQQQQRQQQQQQQQPQQRASGAYGAGLLLYLSEQRLHTELVTPEAAEVRAMLMACNRHACCYCCCYWLLARCSALPRQQRSRQTRSRCYHAAECMLAHAAKEGGTTNSSSGTVELRTAKTGHLPARHLAYYAAWERWLSGLRGITSSCKAKQRCFALGICCT
jgi:hypothetical protein